MMALAAAIFANAQPVINETDVYNIGSSCTYGYDFTGNLTPGNAGANQSYNLQGALIDWSIQMDVVSIANSTYGNILPGNRVILMNQGADGNTYLGRSAGMLVATGEAFQDWNNPLYTHIVPYQPSQVVASFPITYLQQYSGVYSESTTFYIGLDMGQGWVTDSLRTRSTTNYDYTFDGWGTLTTPSGTYNVIRQATVFTSYDTTDIYRSDINQWLINYSNDSTLRKEYTYWAVGEDFPIAVLSDVGIDGSIDDCLWMVSTTTGIASRPAAQPVILAITPNPSDGIITLKTTGIDDASWSLTDLSGKELRNDKLTRETERLSFADLPAGIYMLQVRSKNGIDSQKLVIGAGSRF